LATSGTVTFRSTRDELIKAALRLCEGIDGELNTPTSMQITTAAEALNLIIKQWEADGLQLFSRRWGVVFPQYAQGVFKFGTPGAAGDHASLSTPLGVGDYIKTTLTASMATSGTTASLTAKTSASTSGITEVTAATTYNIGIELDTGYIHWTTINGALSGLNATLTTGVTSAATSGNTVYIYKTKLVRPLRILDAFMRNAAGSDNPVNIYSRDQFARFGYKPSLGTPNSVYYDPQSNSGYLYTYPQFSSVDSQLFIEFQSPIEDFAATGDDFDLPQEWGRALKYNLAVDIAPEYSVSDSKFKQLIALAQESHAVLKGWDQENNSMYLQPTRDH
jgi:hypothetical protein